MANSTRALMPVSKIMRKFSPSPLWPSQRGWGSTWVMSAPCVAGHGWRVAVGITHHPLPSTRHRTNAEVGQDVEQVAGQAGGERGLEFRAGDRLLQTRLGRVQQAG